MSGAHEIGRAVSGNNGDFRIAPKLQSGTSPSALKARLLHDGVTYQQPIKLGIAADVTVYDGSARVEGLSEYLGIYQFEARTPDRMVVTELHAIQNDSWPRLTSINPDNFDLSLPKGAHNLIVTITEADGQGAKLSIADPPVKHGPYKLGVPLKPGLTKYVLTYELPYGGELLFRQSARYFTKKSFIVLPMSMRFTPLAAFHFQSVPDETGAQVREIDSIAKHDVVGFTISGTGALAQAFRQIGGPDQFAPHTLPTQAATKEASPGDTSLTSPASTSNAANQTAPRPAAHSELMSQSGRNWVALAFVLFILGTVIAWKVSRAKVRHGST